MIKIIMSQLKIINFRDIGINSYNFNKPKRNVGNSYIAKTIYSSFSVFTLMFRNQH